MKQCELKLKSSTRPGQPEAAQRNHPMAKLWFQHIRARLEADAGPCEPWRPPSQPTLPWR